MAKARSQLWLMALVFILLAAVVTLAYQHFRAGNIQSAEGRREYDAGRFDLAEAAFERATRVQPAHAEAWFWLGMSRKNQGLPGPAAEALAEATRLNPDEPAWWFEYAQALQWAEEFAASETAWEQVIRRLPEKDPRRQQALINLARAVGAQKETDRAVALLEEALAEKDDPQIRFALAEVLVWGGRLEEAAEQYRRALNESAEEK